MAKLMEKGRKCLKTETFLKDNTKMEIGTEKAWKNLQMVIDFKEHMHKEKHQESV